MGKVISWFSGGVTSAVTCKLCIDIFGIENVRLIFIDTYNEDEDTYRFLKDCEEWYNNKIEIITGIGEEYKSIEDVWYKYKSLNVAHGAICSSELKRKVREKWEKNNTWKYQAFGFELNEIKRAKSMKLNHSYTNPIFPLLMYGYTKKDCIDILQNENIDIPRTYKYGYLNNNCFKSGCVQGGIGYWQKLSREFPDRYEHMAKIEHELTDIKGIPVTMLKDQSNEAKSSNNTLVFLKKHPGYPQIKDITEIKGREPKPLFECNGFCGVNDLNERNETEKEINYQPTLF